MLTKRTAFTAWRRQRPFAGAVLLGASAGLMLLPAVVTVRLGDVLISISTIAGVSTLMLAVLMALCAVSVLLRVDARVPAGVCAMVLSLVALPAANFGGLLVGTLAGVVGSALVLAWIPVLANDPSSSDVEPMKTPATQLKPSMAANHLRRQKFSRNGCRRQ
ncbi:MULTISPECIES: DUF6114 domain-containing protein [Rhodococcus]|uniref:DUF6114 domain-containing protein n=1 Tax=Rhodococcus TaxID=1827 RepID=UPI0008160B4F|nr:MULTISPECIES: DUF6114 domain-containing protein [Rhodococcus]SCC68747.1 hypothetical protein GA0061093_12615 [Rhodococcus qingshengii]